MLGLNQLEKAYLDGDERRLEIEKIVSLRQLDSQAFLALKTNGTCNFNLDEKLFALDFPSHYCRQIKTISLSIPAVVGPYQNLNATLTQTSDKVLIQPDASAVTWLLTGEGSQPDWRQNQQIAISKGTNDNGLFVLNFQDERYLPFEGTGAISHWTLSMPKASNPINFDTITDVIITLSYTALEGGSTISNAVAQNLTKFIGQVALNLKQKLLQNPDPKSLSFVVSPQLFRGNLKNYTLTKIYVQPFGDNSPDSLKLQIPDGGQEIELTKNNNSYTSKDNLGKNYDTSAQTWSLHDKNGLFNPENVTDIALVVAYEGDINWPTPSP